MPLPYERTNRQIGIEFSVLYCQFSMISLAQQEKLGIYFFR